MDPQHFSQTLNILPLTKTQTPIISINREISYNHFALFKLTVIRRKIVPKAVQ